MEKIHEDPYRKVYRSTLIEVLQKYSTGGWTAYYNDEAVPVRTLYEFLEKAGIGDIQVQIECFIESDHVLVRHYYEKGIGYLICELK